MTENQNQPSRWDMPAPGQAASGPYSMPGMPSAPADDMMGGFDFGGMDMSGLLAQAQAMQAQLAAAQEELGAMTFTGTAGGGLVTAKVLGNGELEAVEIKPEACDPTDTESLGDLVVAAVRDAQARMAAVAQAKLGVVSQMGL